MKPRGFLFFCLWIAAPVFAADAPTFNIWNGTWEGNLTSYTVTGQKLETQRVTFVCEMDAEHTKGLQKISLQSKSSLGHADQFNGYFLMDTNGMRRILKTNKGSYKSDLRGHSLDTNKLYWYDIDTNGILREAYVESIEGNTARIHGFRWDGQRTGSYRIFEGIYERKKK
jgi:hypothetical protein